jgi:hypothetical protein
VQYQLVRNILFTITSGTVLVAKHYVRICYHFWCSWPSSRCNKPITIILNGEKLKPFQPSFGIASQRNRTERRNTRNSNRKGEAKLSPFTDDMISGLRDPKLHIINILIKVAVYKINIQKSVAFLYTNNEHTEKEFKNTTSFTIASKKNT